MERRLRVSSSPHIRASRTTASIMRDVIIALAPAGIMGAARFGLRTVYIILIAVFSAVACEFLYNKSAGRPQSVTDLSAVVTGLLVAYNLPAGVPLWLPAVGSALAILLVKMIFGGIGCNFVNPALTARAILMTSWVDHMSGSAFILNGVDAVTSPTPLVQEYSAMDLLLGGTPGCIGEVCRAAILAGAAYLLIRRVISWHIPVAMLATVFLLAWATTGRLWGSTDAAAYQLLSGGLMLGAWFMATDYTTSPVSNGGKLIFGAGCGLIVFLIRRFSAMAEGVSYAILFMNLFVPLIDRYVRPRRFGRRRAYG